MLSRVSVMDASHHRVTHGLSSAEAGSGGICTLYNTLVLTYLPHVYVLGTQLSVKT